MRKAKPSEAKSDEPHHVGEMHICEAVAAPRGKRWRKPRGAYEPLLWDCPSETTGPATGVPGGRGPEDGSAAGRSEHPPARPSADAPLFQSNGHCCDGGQDAFTIPDGRVYGAEGLGQVVGQEYRLRPCRCRKWFCESCGPRLGIKLRQRLLARLATFTDVYGVTLTVDGSLFASPEKAWQYAMDNRLLSRLVRDLERRGHLHSKAYFWVVEFQKETEQPHWHMLLDASFVPYGEIVEVWSRFRPASAEPVAERITPENYQGQAPAFGSVRYTRHPDKLRAGYYATKYLTKYPASGYPDWVLNCVGRMPRYGHSHRLFPRMSGHDPMCFCGECCGEAVPPASRRPPQAPASPDRVRRRHEPKSIRQRVEACEGTCSIVQVQRVQLPDGVVIDGRSRFDGNVNLSFQEACEYLGLSFENRWQIELDGPTATDLEEYAKACNGMGGDRMISRPSSDGSDAVEQRRVSWIDDKLLAQTKAIWEPLYGRPLTTAESLEILLSVGRLLDAI